MPPPHPGRSQACIKRRLSTPQPPEREQWDLRKRGWAVKCVALQESNCSLASVSPPSCPAILQGLGRPPLRGVGKGCCQPLKADGSGASTALPQASPPRISARIPLPLLTPTPTGWDRPQPAGLPALINTGQAAKAAAGSILPGGPSSARVTGGRGCSLAQGLWWWGGGGGRAEESRKGRHHSQSHLFLHPLIFRSHWFRAQIFSEHHLCMHQACRRLWGTVRTAPVELMFWGGWGEIIQINK